MTYEVGETVVYPHHGAARIIDIRQRKVRGEEKTYLQLEVAQGDLTILVPAESVELIGVRDVVDETGLEKVFEVLRAPLTEEPTNWSRRFKANQEKIASGDVIKVAEVVRDLSRRDTDRGLSAGEKRMLAKARQILVSELALAEHTNEDKAEATLDEVLGAFPDTPINIEIKGSGTPQSFLAAAEALGSRLADSDRTDLIVGSFDDAALARIRALADLYAPGEPAP